jgi:hypothetical protein
MVAALEGTVHSVAVVGVPEVRVDTTWCIAQERMLLLRIVSLPMEEEVVVVVDWAQEEPLF